jgi:hypothetical protein
MTNVVALAPTVERVRQAKFGIEEPSIDQKVNRPYTRVKDIWADMRARKQITDREEDAGRRFSAAYDRANKGNKITPSYGLVHAEGTPVSQLATSAAEEDSARWVDYYALYKQALECLPETGQTAMRMAAAGNNLDEIGRHIFGYKSNTQARGAGAVAVRMSLSILCIYYERPLKVPRG